MTSPRIARPGLAARRMDAAQAAEWIQPGMAVGMSGFTGAGYPKALPTALHDRIVTAHARGEDFRIGLWTGASTAPDADGVLAEAKGADVHRRLHGDEGLVLACDSVLEVGGRVHGKPGEVEVARRRWREELRGRSGVLHTGHWVIDPRTGRAAGAPASATVHFADLDDDEIEGYLATGEPLWVAGGFTLDGLGSPFVESIEGHPSTVVGLCMPLLRRLLADLDVRWWDVASDQSRG